MNKWKQVLAKCKPIFERLKGLDQQQKKRCISIVCAAALILMLAVMPMMAAREQEEDGPVASVLSGVAELGTVEQSIHVGGTLAEEDAVAIRLPDGVKITEFLVENYTEVKQGDALAAVDSVSVMKAITDVQATLEQLKKDIEGASNNTVSKTLSADAGGKVKAVYAMPGDDVSAVMTQYGALAVLSLDGYMAVKFETDAKLSAGDSVWVGFEDGTDVLGRVESAQNGEAVVTVEDKNYPIGVAVVITDSDDDELGEGELYVHHAWNAVAYSGTVSSVNLKENTTVSAGKNIITLKSVENSSYFQMLSQRHREYEELMAELFVMYQSGAILAPCDGVVSGVDKDSIHLLSSESGFNITWLANAPGVDPDGTFKNYVGQLGAVAGMQWSVLFNATEYAVDDYLNLSGVSTDSALMTLSHDMTAVTVFELVDGVWQIVTDAKQGDILLFAGDGAEFVWAIRIVKAVEDTPDVPDVPEQPDGGETPDGSQNPPGDGTQGGNIPQQRPSGGMGGMGGITNFGGMGGAAQKETEDLFDLKGTNILYVTPQNIITLRVAVDESDIAKLRVGQEAVVTVDVLKGQTYSATITEVGVTGTDEGGSSKYEMEMTMERGENMLVGQSASAVIVLDSAENVLVIPVAALVEEGSKTVVYTGMSQGRLTKPVPVSTGVSDGEFVEITEGLVVGSPFFYSYYDTHELSTAVK